MMCAKKTWHKSGEVIFCFLSVALLSRYRRRKDKSALLLGILFCIVSIGCICWYFVKAIPN